MLFYTAGSRNGLHKMKLHLRKNPFFGTGMGKYVQDVKQGDKSIPDLVESIMRPTDPVKEDYEGFRAK